VLNLRVSWNAGKLSSGLTSSGLSSSAQLHRVSYFGSYCYQKLRNGCDKYRAYKFFSQIEEGWESTDVEEYTGSNYLYILDYICEVNIPCRAFEIVFC
jgi:hypothetical protein